MSLLMGTLGEPTLHFEGVFPKEATFEYQNVCALDRGIGITDMSPEPGNDVSAFFEKSGVLPQRWVEDTYRAFEGHMKRVGATLEFLLQRADGAGGAGDARRVGEKRKREEENARRKEKEEELVVLPPGFASSLLSAEEAREALDVFSRLAAWQLPQDTGSAAGGAGAATSSSSSSPSSASSASATSSAPSSSSSSSVVLQRTTKAAQCRDPRFTAPRVVACTGKTQWTSLFRPPLKRCDHGLQPASLRPPGWPFPASTHVFVLASSSGRAALSNEARSAPYRELAGLVNSMPWIKPQGSHPLEAGAALLSAAVAGAPPALPISSASSSSSAVTDVASLAAFARGGAGASPGGAGAGAGAGVSADAAGGSAKKKARKADADEGEEAKVTSEGTAEESRLAIALVKAAPCYREK